MYRLPTILLSLLLLPLALAAPDAQCMNVYRCTGEDGSVSFSDRPCPVGQPMRQINMPQASQASKPGAPAAQGTLERVQTIRSRSRTKRRRQKVFGVASSRQIQHCEKAKERLSQHRAAMRKPHPASARTKTLLLRKKMRLACDY